MWPARGQGPDGHSGDPGEGDFSPFSPPAWGQEPKSAFSGWAHLAVAPPNPQHQTFHASTSTLSPRWYLPWSPQIRVLIRVGIGASGSPLTFDPYRVWISPFLHRNSPTSIFPPERGVMGTCQEADLEVPSLRVPESCPGCVSGEGCTQLPREPVHSPCGNPTIHPCWSLCLVHGSHLLLWCSQDKALWPPDLGSVPSLVTYPLTRLTLLMDFYTPDCPLSHHSWAGA